MAPDVLLRKLLYLRQLLIDLAPYENATLAEVEAEHYKLERLLELLVATATDILFHKLAEMDVAPDSYREAFRLAGEHGLLPRDLAERMQNAAGMRNVLVHLYEEIDYQILHDSIRPALQDFSQFTAVFAQDLE
ncbi:MAG: DUF86 domain-containing protein [Ardenticatenaceae bacterium]|nr:DUF86 domain-containing protein [Ardenticatenaceae bacterium]MCB8988201.1 DUF86 domain-containing protein [Ardenticatenaceae bacterium]